jgi:hypothetical protein
MEWADVRNFYVSHIKMSKSKVDKKLYIVMFAVLFQKTVSNDTKKHKNVEVIVSKSAFT